MIQIPFCSMLLSVDDSGNGGLMDAVMTSSIQFQEVKDHSELGGLYT